MLCFNCFKEYDSEFGICPHCGSGRCDEALEPIHLAPGTMLQGRYMLGQAVGAGGFGIIYRAWDTKLETIIAIKEFFSPRLMARAAGESKVIVSRKNEQEFIYRKERFLAEARNMAKFSDHRSIPNVFEFFEDNGTAYIVMELLEGIGLNTFIQQSGGKLERDFAVHVATEVGAALKSLHAKGIIHRDVAPDNVFICSDKDLKIKLLDLGAAKLSNDDDTVIDIILKPGYSPTEQYDNTGAIGTWTDVYALGATLYVMLTGIKPDEATNRKQNDTLVPPIEIDTSIPENLSNTVMKAMAIDKHMRFKSVDEFLKALNGERKVLTLAKERKRKRRKQILGLSAALLVLIAGAFAVWKSYNNMEVEEYLEEATISVWYAAEEGSAEETAMNYVVKNFGEKFSSVSIELRRIDNEDYAATIEEANKLGVLPSVFESTGLEDNYLTSANSLAEVLNTEQAARCNLLSKYNDYYSDTKRIPLGFEVPMAIVITGGNSRSSFDRQVFSDISVFGNVNIAADSASIDILSKNFTPVNYSEEAFLAEDGNCAVLLTSSMKFHSFKEDTYLMKCEWHAAFPIGAVARYTYEWSSAASGKAEQAAAERLISWMLGNNYQNKLMISLAQDGTLPLNTDCFNAFCNGSADFADLPSVCSDYKFVR